MKLRIAVAVLSLTAITLCCQELHALKTHKVKAEYTYYAPSDQSPERAKRIALDRAKIEIIAEKFGTVVSQTTSMTVSAGSEESGSRFNAVASTDLRGEWIETTSEPKYDISFVDNNLVVKVEVEGKIRELRPNGIDFSAVTLRNGTTIQSESTEFTDGDDMYLLFRTPQPGYVAAFLLDEQVGECYCLLPYKGLDGCPVAVKKDTDYIFFSEALSPDETKGLVDEYTLTCEREMEFNTLYVIFSRKEFSRPATSGRTEELMPVSTPLAGFMKWLSRMRANDSAEINCVSIPISISAKNS